MLESHFQELERTLDREREVWQQKLSQKEQELLNMRAQMYSQLEDYENLLDVKLTLDMEINAYRTRKGKKPTQRASVILAGR